MGAVTMPDGSTRTGGSEQSEYVVATRSGITSKWNVRGWFPNIEEAEACERANLGIYPRGRVALLAVDDPEGDE